MSVTRQWARELVRFAPSLRVHVHHGGERLTGTELAEVASASDVVITSYDIATRDVDALAVGRLGPAAPRRGAGRQEPDHQACPGAPPDPGASGSSR